MDPNAHLKNVGNANAQGDIDECLRMAENSGVGKSGSIWDGWLVTRRDSHQC